MPQTGPDTWDLHFPKAGLDVSRAFAKQPFRDVSDGLYARSAPQGVNVRAYEPAAGRLRGGSRWGLSKYVNAQLAGTTWIVQHLSSVTYIDRTGGVQLSNSGRVVKLLGVSQGRVFTTVPDSGLYTEATNNTGETPPLNYSGLVRSTQCVQKLWLVDGINYAVYDPQSDTVNAWTASAGSLPADSQQNTARLICTWRGRVVLSGLPKDPQNWFMSKVNDPTNFDYGPSSASPTDAVAGNNAPMGLIGDVVTTLIPHSDDLLIFGGDSSIFMMRGDPLAGGQIDRVSDSIGMAWGAPWCKDPNGVVYFFSSRCGIYRMVPGEVPVRISQQIEPLLQQIDTGENGIIMAWEDRFQQLRMFVTPLSAPAATIHYTWEQRTNSWWQDNFSDPNKDPLCCCVVDGNGPDDRCVVIGSWDGYVRKLDPDATTDDGDPIVSSVTIGPLLTPVLDDVRVDEIQPVLGAASGDVTAEVFVGASAEAALVAASVVSDTWEAGRNLTTSVRRAGHALYVKLSSSVRWALESIRVKLTLTGATRRRGK